MANQTFFSQVNTTWNEYSSLRNKYTEQVPVPQRAYFNPIRSIDDFATLAVRPIEKPLWFAINTFLFLLKTALSCAISVILAPCALVTAIIMPKTELSAQIGSAFKLAAAHTLVSAGMTILAFLSTAAAMIFNPLFVASRAVATLIDGLNSVTESCCGLTIAKL